MPKSILFDRDETIAKVTSLFWEKGYHATSMQDLVDVTGLNRSSIYNSFGDKYNLFIESLKHYKKEQINGLDNFRHSGMTAKEIITAV